MKAFNIEQGKDGGYITYEDDVLDEFRVMATLDQVIQQASEYFGEPLVEEASHKPVGGDTPFGRVLPDFYYAEPTPPPVTEEEEMVAVEEEADKPDNPNVRRSETKPTEDPGEGFEWVGTICKNVWVRKRVGR